MTSSRQRAKLVLLQTRKANLCRQLDRLVEDRDQLHLKQHLLDSLVSVFDLLEANTQRSLHSSLAGAQLVQHHQELQQLAAGLAQPLPPFDEAAAAAALPLEPDTAVDRIAPRHDPMALFRLLLSQPGLQEAATITALEVAALQRDTVLQAGVLLAQLDSNLPSASQKLQDLGHRYLRLVVALMLAGRMPIIAEVSVYDLSRLRPDPDTAAAAGWLRMLQMPPLLGLSEQQMQDITAGMCLFGGLLQPILQQQRQLHAQLSSACSTGSSSGGGGGGQQQQHAHGSLAALERSMELRAQHAARMAVLIDKEYTLRMAACAWFIGTLTWQQYARASVLCWPWPLRLPALAEAIVQYYQQQQQQLRVRQPQQQQQEEEEEEQRHGEQGEGKQADGRF